jgi:hypothetical protein
MRSSFIAALSVAVITLILLLQVFLVGGSDQVDLEGFEDEKNRFISEYISSEYRYEVSEPAKTDYGPSNSVETSTRWTENQTNYTVMFRAQNQTEGYLIYEKRALISYDKTYKDKSQAVSNADQALEINLTKKELKCEEEKHRGIVTPGSYKISCTAEKPTPRGKLYVEIVTHNTGGETLIRICEKVSIDLEEVDQCENF